MPKCTVEAEAGPFASEGAQAQAAILEEKARLQKDPDVVEFDGPMDPLNPQVSIYHSGLAFNDDLSRLITRRLFYRTGRSGKRQARHYYSG